MLMFYKLMILHLGNSWKTLEHLMEDEGLACSKLTSPTLGRVVFWRATMVNMVQVHVLLNEMIDSITSMMNPKMDSVAIRMVNRRYEPPTKVVLCW